MLRALKRLLNRAAVDPAQLPLPFGFGPGPVALLPPASPPPTQAPRSATAPPERRRRSPAEQDTLAAQKLTARHAELNVERFGAGLRTIRIEVSPRLRSRLGYYRIATPRVPGLIVISRRHLRRHGWSEAFDTLLHEMIHQWQDESGLAVDHGRQFRAKARAVGAVPRARRPV